MFFQKAALFEPAQLSRRAIAHYKVTDILLAQAALYAAGTSMRYSSFQNELLSGDLKWISVHHSFIA